MKVRSIIVFVESDENALRSAQECVIKYCGKNFATDPIMINLLLIIIIVSKIILLLKIFTKNTQFLTLLN